MKTGLATFSLDTGKCPRWLFERMKKLGGLCLEIMLEDFGPKEVLRRLSHPTWFQSFGCLLAFDWNSSGLTVVLTAALKEASKERNLNIYFAGGKGKSSRKTPEELMRIGEKTGLDGEKYAKISRLIAKVDNLLIQDGFNLYHHVFIIDNEGDWTIIQQGMNSSLKKARRYHWCSLEKSMNNLTEDPHSGIISETILERVLDLTSKNSSLNKKGIIEIIREDNISLGEIKKILSFLSEPKKKLFLDNVEFRYHPVVEERFDIKRLIKNIAKAKFFKPKTIEDLLLVEGIGAKTIRSLSLLSEVIFGHKPSYEDPARYTFAHGGKDGTPYFVDRETYDETIRIVNKAFRISKKRLVI